MMITSKDRWLVLLSGFLVSLGFLFLYYFTHARLLVNFADSTDLILAGIANGRAHPPGYALLTNIIFVVDKLFGRSFSNFHMISGVFQAIANGLMVILIVKILVYARNSFNRLMIVAGIFGGVIWGLTVNVWMQANVMEVFALINVLTVIFLICLFEYLLKRSVVLMIMTGVIAGLMVGFHQLSILIVFTSLIFLLLQVRKESKWKKKFHTDGWLLLISFFVSLGTSIFLLPSLNVGEKYSWIQDWSLEKGVNNFLRKIYAPGGSAIETYVNELNINHSLTSEVFFAREEVLSIGLIGILLLVLGIIFLYKQQRWLFWWLLTCLFLTGPLLVFYLKFPQRELSYDIEYFWGIAYRMRMFFGFEMLTAIGAGLGAYFVLEFVGKKYSRIGLLLIGILVLLLGIRMTTIYSRVDASQNNFTDLFLKELLNDLPENSLLLTDTDMGIGLIGQQQVSGIRKDIDIYPINVDLRPGIKNEIVNMIDSNMYPFDDVYEAILITVDALKNGRRVYWYDMPVEAEVLLGLEANPLYAIPSGYLLEISSESGKTISDYDYGLSKSLSMTEDLRSDWWVQGIKVHVASLHARNSYYLARLGMMKAADQHEEIAIDLSGGERTKMVIHTARAQGEQRFLENGSYQNYLALDVEDYLGQARLASSDQEFEYFLTRSLFVDMDNVEMINEITEDDRLLSSELSDFLDWLAGLRNTILE